VVAEVKRYKRYDLQEVAQILGVDLATVRRWVEHGMLPTLQIGERHLVKGADLFLVGLITEPSEQVRIDLEGSQFNAPGNDNENLRQQYVCFVNKGSSAVDMSSWHVQDRTGATYDFPSFTLQPGATVCLRTGKGSNSETDLYWGRGSSVWRNEGDTVSLFDRLWNVVDRKAYGEDAKR
jgi:excisionase family DNA binding protein